MGTVTVGSPASIATGGNSGVTVTLPTVSIGDAIAIPIGWINASGTGGVPNGPVAPSGWTLVAAKLGGSTIAANAAGQRGFTWLVREVDGTEGSSLAIAFPSGASFAAMTARAYPLTKTAGEWDFACGTGEDSTSGADFSATADIDPGIAAGDAFLAGAAWVPGNRTPSGQAVSWPGATLSSLSQSMNTSNLNGWDVRTAVWDGTCTGGESTGAPTLTLTPSSTIDGGPFNILRVRAFEAPAGPAITIWNGSAEVPATLYIWNGSAEVPATGEIA